MPSRRMHPILHALVERNLLVCVGPLVPEAAGLAGPRRLAQRCIESLHPLLRSRAEIADLVADGEVSRALERAERFVGSARFVDLARPLLDRGDAQLPLVARAVAALSPALRRICTTNLDTLLERALETWPTFDDEPRDLGRRERCLIKLCGTAAQVTSWVLTRERLLARGSELPRTASWLRSHRLLIVGYRADDEVLRQLVLGLRGRDAARDPLEPPVNLALVPADSVTPESRALLGEHGLALVPIVGDYDLGAAEWLHALIDAFQRETRTRIAELPGHRRPHDRRWGHAVWCPYPGLVPFSSDDETQLFGRAGDVHRAVEQLRTRPESRWLIVHGADGIGASSFVAAGLYPAMVRGAAWMLPGEPTWVGLQGRLDRRPLLALAEGLTSLGPRRDLAERSYADEYAQYEQFGEEPELAEDPSWEAAVLHDQFGASARALTDRLASPHLHGLVLVIDGLEEAIDSDDDDEREQFAAVLAHALAHATGPFLLITPIRSRYLGELHRLPQLHERMIGRDPPVLYALAPLGEDGLRQAIRGPGERARLIVAERLVDRILADLDRLTRGPQPPPPGIVLALLTAALSGTHRCMTYGEFCVTAYEAAGGLTGAVESLAERALAGAIEDYTESRVRQVFLMVIAGGVDRRGHPRPLTRDEVIKRLIAEGPTAPPRHQRIHAENVLRRTAIKAGGLVSVSARSVTLVHDVLLSYWPRLRAWQASDWRPQPERPAPTHHAPAAAQVTQKAQEQRSPGPARQAATATPAARVVPATPTATALMTVPAAPVTAITAAPAATATPAGATARLAAPARARRHDVLFSIGLAIAVAGGLMLGRSTGCPVRVPGVPSSPRGQPRPPIAVQHEAQRVPASAAVAAESVPESVATQPAPESTRLAKESR